MITPAQIKTIIPAATAKAVETFTPLLNLFMPEYSIIGMLRQAAFLAQIAHESGSLRYTRELASGNAYEGRADLGNIHKGDGQKFKGRGLIQITGRTNYAHISKAFGVDFTQNPDLLSAPSWAVRSACWWWREHGLNQLADDGDFKGITRVINGGYNGYAERMEFYLRAKNVLIKL